MPLANFLGRRRVKGQMDTALRELQSVRGAAEEAAAAAAIAAAASHRSEEAVIRALNNPPPPSGEPGAAGHFVRLIWFCVLMIAGAIVAATFVPAAFTSPPATFDDPSGVQVLVESNNSATSIGESYRAGVYIAAQYSQGAGWTPTYYTLFFPRSFVGKKFVVALSGSAVLADPQTPEQRASITTDTCHAYKGGFGRGNFTQPCQIIQGTVPDHLASIALECIPPSVQAHNSDEVSVYLTGLSPSNNQRLNWAHWMTTLPTFYSYKPDSSWDYRGLALNGKFGGIQEVGCKGLRLNEEWEVGDLSENTTLTAARELIWADGNASMAVVSKERGAEGIGNILLATAGALAALGIGFIPVAYEAWRQWRRSIRLRGAKSDPLPQ